MDEIGKALEMKVDNIAADSVEAHAGPELPLFDEFYVDWAAFDFAVATAIEKHHPIRKRSSLTFEVYNRTVSKGRHDRKPIAEFLSKTFKCTHGIKFRSRGTGKRSRHKVRDIQCPFHIYATAIEDGTTGYRVKVRTHDKHNHPIGPDANKSMGALHDSDYEYTEAHSATIGEASAASMADAVNIVGAGVVSSPPSDGDMQLHMNSFSQTQTQLQHHHDTLHSQVNTSDLLDAAEQDGVSLLEGAIDSHIPDFSSAPDTAVSAATAAAPADAEAPATSATSSDAQPRFEDSMTLEELRRKLSEFADDRDWNQFHSPRNLLLALSAEMGELSECFQWKGDNMPVEEWTAEERVHLGEEISDVMMYLILLADKCGINLPTAILDKMAKNARRFPAEVVRGSAKKFQEFNPKRARVEREASL